MLKRALKMAALLGLSFSASVACEGQALELSAKGGPGSFALFTQAISSTVIIDQADAKVVHIAARALANDLGLVSGKEIMTGSEIPANDHVIIAGTIGHSEPIDQLIKNRSIDVSAIKGQWERFIIGVISVNNRPRLVIAGSDRRGTAFGIFHLSRLLGVSPLVWWADLLPTQRKELFVSGSYTSPPPSVKFRGIFINDEDWGLQPWAARNMDTAIKDIGPNTYARVFELMLRLKANYIWPAMHPCTKAFYYYRENPKIADDYAIIVGGSHCEPMLRNNVFEWAENFEHEYSKKPGQWRYDLNKEEIYQYWNDRVKESAGYESVYTVGMRGIHDGSMPGPADPNEKLKLLENVINDQRSIFGINIGKPVSEVPQIFVPYKEVLSLYRRGLKLPDDITIVWPDDNHGYIRQLPNQSERKRSGGHGVYYHLSYWGSPHDYLWLSSISPTLISYELTKAYKHGADRLWVFNVGDIKPAELELQFAMDLAWDVGRWPPERAGEYTQAWARESLGDLLDDDHLRAIGTIKNWYYRLAASGKPEHMHLIDLSYKEATERLSQYWLMYQATESIGKKLPERLQDAWYQLFLYPAYGAALMNQKILMAKFSFNPVRKTKFPQFNDCALSRDAFKKIIEITSTYNETIASGKWNGMMSWHPRDLAVFNMPLTWDSATNSQRDSLSRAYFSVAEPELAYLASRALEKKQTSKSKLKVIEGLGIASAAITATQLSPLSNQEAASIGFPPIIGLKLKPGKYTIIVKCLPTFDVGNSKQVRYSIAAGDEIPKTVNVHAEADSKEWKENVIRGYSAGRSVHTLTGNETVTIWLNDPGLVISTIEFYKQ